VRIPLEKQKGWTAMTIVGAGGLLEVLLFAVLMIAFWRQVLLLLLTVAILVFAVGLHGVLAMFLG
jgi:hypothetical protein